MKQIHALKEIQVTLKTNRNEQKQSKSFELRWGNHTLYHKNSHKNLLINELVFFF